MIKASEHENEVGQAPIACSWRGCSMKEILGNLPEFSLPHILPVQNSEDHTVLYELPIEDVPKELPPIPRKGEHKWDTLHVRLPCSSESLFSSDEEDNSCSPKQRWNIIKETLSKSIRNTQELQEALLVYNPEYKEKWNFTALHKIFDEELNGEESQDFFEDLLPRIIRLALEIPNLIQAPIPLLKQDRTHSVTLSKQQISCLLANAFLCTFPQRNTMKRKAVDPEYKSFPEINFHRLFQSTGQMILEKLKCMFNYFRRVCPKNDDNTNVPTGVVTFTRRSLNQTVLPDWTTSSAEIGKTLFHINSSGVIEDSRGLLQVDFANKYIGGGVLGSGCVQEEIRFIICPELIVSKLFTEFLRPTEALFMSGCEEYSKYTGYSSTFKWVSDHIDATPRDTSRRCKTHIVAIDALSFRIPQQQYREDLMLRELNKAYTGFLHELETTAPGIATGNWGCGAYRGDPRLKALLQLMVCTVTERALVYYTFGDTKLRDDVYNMYELLQHKKVKICDLWKVLCQFYSKELAADELYDFIKSGIENPLNEENEADKIEK